MSEWFKVRAWKARVPKRYRGFESPSFRNMRPDAPQVLLAKPRQRRNPATVCIEGCAGDYLTSFFIIQQRYAHAPKVQTSIPTLQRAERSDACTEGCAGDYLTSFFRIQQRYAHAPKVQTSITSLQRAERSDAYSGCCAGDYLASFFLKFSSGTLMHQRCKRQ